MIISASKDRAGIEETDGGVEETDGGVEETDGGVEETDGGLIDDIMLRMELMDDNEDNDDPSVSDSIIITIVLLYGTIGT